jgi:predicted SprT family Zn-dependent metalloprotease
MNKIPNSFKLFASNITIDYDDIVNDALDHLGTAYMDLKKIRLATKTSGKDLPQDSILDTFYHELVHMILYHMNEKKLCSDEKFVDTFAKLLRQALETAKYNENE